MIETILKKGYFPRELPPPFSSGMFSAIIQKNIASLPSGYDWSGSKKPNYVSRPTVFNLARNGDLRRKLSIPNPVNSFQQAKVVAENWTELEAHYHTSNKSLSRPEFSKTQVRALNWAKGFDVANLERLRIRASKRYILKTDISKFYPTLYTHSIPWALHGKPIAKSKRAFADLAGNKLDRVIQNGQDGQTKGVPIGPDISHVIAEVILTNVDASISREIGNNYFRFMDDYEFSFNTYTEAERALAVLSEIFNEYELDLSSEKTSIFSLPRLIEEAWVTDLKAIEIGSSHLAQQNGLISLFNKAIELQAKDSSQAVIKYALQRTTQCEIKSENWDLYQNILYNFLVAESGTIPVLIDILKYHEENGFAINKELLNEALSRTILEHAAKLHSSELSWAVWACLCFGIKLDSEVTRALCRVKDPVVALICLDAHDSGLLHSDFDATLWTPIMVAEELKGPFWMLAYEALFKGWLPSAGTKNYLDTQKEFKFLKDNNVTFYNRKRTSTYKGGLKLRGKKNSTLKELIEKMKSQSGPY
ncbi:RNA-directed DNA polymerase [Microbulbifer variabilis]|uniref:RNA-directed DNA polymerase n=1 Tax=Microbulbifer variabilis TaxID=266805 RepID=UPI001CFDAC5E|nr:RNA-directed DNA polymerase [Microbulbifer variabilis]